MRRTDAQGAAVPIKISYFLMGESYYAPSTSPLSGAPVRWTGAPWLARRARVRRPMGDGRPFAPREVFPHTRRGEKRRRSFPLYTRRRKKDSVSFRRHARQKNAPHEAQRASQPPAAHWAAGAFSRWNVPRYIPAKLLYENLIKAFILVLDKKLSKLFIAPQARQELMRRLLRQTAAKGRC